MNSEYGNKITDLDVYNLAQEFGLKWSDVKMIMEVESRGSGFYKNSIEPVVLFEGKWFHNLTNGIYDKDYPWLSFPVNNSKTRKYYDRNQVQQIQDAYKLNKKAALMSASWGAMQVMGFNYRLVGYGSVEDFVKDMYRSELYHIRAGLMYIKNAGLIPAIKAKNYDALRRGYNGNTEVDTYNYMGKLKAADIKWMSVEPQMINQFQTATTLAQ